MTPSAPLSTKRTNQVVPRYQSTLQLRPPMATEPEPLRLELVDATPENFAPYGTLISGRQVLCVASSSP
jgi:hypothetical protein